MSERMYYKKLKKLKLFIGSLHFNLRIMNCLILINDIKQFLLRPLLTRSIALKFSFEQASNRILMTQNKSFCKLADKKKDLLAIKLRSLHFYHSVSSGTAYSLEHNSTPENKSLFNLFSRSFP
jgi:hypothetical protein